MRLSSYMRGIGIGIAVTALILHFTDGSASAMSDEQVKARAGELGMVAEENIHERLATPAVSGNGAQALLNVGEATATPTITVAAAESPTPTSASVVTPTPEEAQEATATEAPTETPTPTEAPTATPTLTPTPTPQPTATPTPTQKPTETPTPTPDTSDADGGRVSLNTQEVEIRVVSGDGSYNVAKRLAEAGVVSSAAEFDEFLCRNGYDRKISTGKHVIPAQCSYTRIAQILTGK